MLNKYRNEFKCIQIQEQLICPFDINKYVIKLISVSVICLWMVLIECEFVFRLVVPNPVSVKPHFRNSAIFRTSRLCSYKGISN